MKTSITSPKAPAPIGPYSHAIHTGNLLFVSGMVGKDPVSGAMVQETIEAETRQTMENIKSILSEAGLTVENIVKTSIFLVNLDHFTKVNTVYGSYFSGNYPARETIQVSRLPANANIEISVIAEYRD